MGFQHIMPWLPRGGDPFLPIQIGSVDLDEPNTFVTVTIPAVNLSKAVLEFTYSGDANQVNPRDCWVSGQITNPTTLTFQRAGSTPGSGVNIIINWWVWEASPSSPMTVIRGSAQIGNMLPLPVNVTIPAVDLAKSFPIITSRADQTSFPNDETAVKAKLTTSTNLELYKIANSPLFMESHIVEYQIISNSAWDIQQIDVNMPLATLNQAITSIPLAQSYFAASGTFGVGRSITGRYNPIFVQTTPTNVFFERFDALDAWDFSLYCVNTNGDFSTQHITNAIPGSFNTQNFALSAVDLTKTFMKMNSVLNGEFQKIDASNFSIYNSCGRLSLTSPTVGRIDRFNAYVFPLHFRAMVCEFI